MVELQKKFPYFSPGCKYYCQKNSWMDERVMIEWVSYWCYMMTSVVDSIQQLGEEVEHIPGGCTSLCQPVMLKLTRH